MSLLIGATSGLQGAAGAAGGGGDLGETIDQSIRFRAEGSATYLSNTGIVGGATGNYTVSVWLKLGHDNLTSSRFILTSGSGGTNTSSIGYCNNGIDSQFMFREGGDNTLQTGVDHRDPSAWYHVVCQQDADNNTQKLFVNGDQVGSTNTGSSASGIFSQSPVAIAYYAGSVTNGWEGYMAEFNFLETVLAPTDFARYNDDGVWVPKKLDFTSVQYGESGFRLQFDSSAGGGVGDDSAPTGTGHSSANDFTANNIETTAISSSNFDNDIDYFDTPTSNFATFNPAATLPNNVSVSSLTHANLRLTSTASGYINSYSTIPASDFDCYCEIEVTERAGSGLLGIGVGDSEAIIATGAGAYVTYREDGSIVKYPGNTSLGTESSYTTGDVLAMTVTSTQVAFYKNGTLEGTYSHSLTGDFFIIGMAYYNSGNAILDYNFGQRDFRYTVPTGFKALQTNNLPEPTIKNGKEHFDVVTYSGTGASHTRTDLEFQPDFIWFKHRSGGGGEAHALYDSVRGVQKSLEADNDNPEQTVSQGVTAFNSDGWTMGTSSQINGSASSQTYVAWCWKAGGTAVSNTDGTITSSVSANTDAGFSIVSYTGTATNATVGHGLNSAPDVVVVKGRDTADQWHVKHKDLSSNNNSVRFNSTAQQADFSVWQNTAPTSTVFSIGTQDGVNKSGDDFIAYCWHSVEGYSSYGSYEGNGTSGDGPYVYTGHKPHFLIIKSVDVAGDWVMLDTTRTPNNPNENGIKGNSSIAEAVDGNYTVDFLSNGFKIRNNADADLNSSGQTYIYMSWAEHPFGGENAPPATAR